MRVGILGSGAMGKVMGAFMTKNGCQVDLIDNYEAHVDALNARGAHIIGTVDMTVPVKAMLPEQMTGVYDIIFLFTKQLANEQVLPALLPHLGPDSTVCTLQNGVPEPYVAQMVGKERTVGGTILWGATFIKPGVSELTQDITKNDHLFEIGEMDGTIGQRIQQVSQVLGYMGPAKITDQLMASRWGKLINNACMSGMSAACGATFGEVLQNPRSCACLSYLGREVMVCAQAEGYQLPILLNELPPDSLALEDQAMYEENQRMFKVMYQDMHPAKASMLQDLEKGKKNEVGMINGYVCQAGRKHGIPTPFNDMVVSIVHRIEKGELPLSMDNLQQFPQEWFTFA